MSERELDELQKRINSFKQPKIKPRDITHTIGAFTVAIELVAGIIVGLIIGLFFDRMFGTKPIFLIVCLIMGIIASLKIIWQKLNSKNDGT